MFLSNAVRPKVFQIMLKEMHWSWKKEWFKQQS